MPDNDPEIYAAERPATGPRGSLLAYRSNVFHRGVNLTAPAGSRFAGVVMPRAVRLSSSVASLSLSASLNLSLT